MNMPHANVYYSAHLGSWSQYELKFRRSLAGIANGKLFGRQPRKRIQFNQVTYENAMHSKFARWGRNSITDIRNIPNTKRAFE